jgi:hypothetical protein
MPSSYDHLIAGISAYPDLERRLAADLSYAKSSNKSVCGNCKTQQIVRKYKSLIDIRKKKEPPPRRY